MKLSIETLQKQLRLIDEREDTVAAKAVKELIEYKEIEEEFGTDLRILAKAKKNGIWRKMYGDEIRYFDSLELSVYIDHLETDSGKQLYLFEYGDKWALTKEELV